MVRSIKVRWASSRYVHGRHDGVRVRFDVDCASGLDTRIFAYRMRPVNSSGSAEGFFSHICSPVDMAEYPADEPVAGQSPEWFRLSFVDVMLRSVTEADDFIAAVRSDVRRILATLSTMDTIFTNGTDLIGDDCDPVDSSSQSSEGEAAGSLSHGDLVSIVTTGTTEQSVGTGVYWSSVGSGAGSPVGSSDSFGANSSRVELGVGGSSKLLLVQGFDFSSLPDDCVIEGIQSRVTLRDATNGAADDSSASVSTTTTCPTISLLALQHPDLGMSANRGDDECITGPGWETISRGGDGDRWDFSSIPVAVIKDGSFGLGIVVHANNTYAAAVEVDGVEIEVFFKEVV